MSRETFEEYLTRLGTPVRMVDVAAFDNHRRSCETCQGARYAYQQCPEGLQLARRVSGLDIRR